MAIVTRRYYNVPFYSDCVSDKILKEQIPLIFPEIAEEGNEQVHRVLSLFSGCGGLSLGFQKQGFEVVAAFEWWKRKVCINESV